MIAVGIPRLPLIYAPRATMHAGSYGYTALTSQRGIEGLREEQVADLGGFFLLTA